MQYANGREIVNGDQVVWLGSGGAFRTARVQDGTLEGRDGGPVHVFSESGGNESVSPAVLLQADDWKDAVAAGLALAATAGVRAADLYGCSVAAIRN